MSAPLIIITGPSAAGKTTVAECLLKRKSLKLKRFVTCTTRPKRKGEVNHKDYHFIKEADFKKAINNKEMLEWSKVYGEHYGSNKKDLLKALDGKNPILMVVDIQGVKKLKKLKPACCIIYIDVPKKTFLKRIKQRALNLTDFKARAAQYDKEQNAKKLADIVIINKDGRLRETVEKAACIIGYGLLLQKKGKNGK
ncbi:MAG: guanylate kinase [Patescibacteria group bacterium]